MATCDVTQLLADGKCFMCLNKKQADAVLAQMLCNLIASAVIPEEACENLFQDGFDGPDNQELFDPPWRDAADTFVYASGRATEEPGSAGSCQSWVRASSMTDGYVQARCYGTGGNHILLFRTDPDVALSFYAAGLDPVNEAVFINRGSTTLATVFLPDGYTPGDLMRFEMRGSQMILKYNGESLLIVSDTSGSAIAGPGLAGMRSGAIEADTTFDDFECCSWD